MGKLSTAIFVLVGNSAVSQFYFNELIDLSGPLPEVYRSLDYNPIDSSIFVLGASTTINPILFRFKNDFIVLDTAMVECNSSGIQYYTGFESGVFLDNFNKVVIPGQMAYSGSNASGIIFKTGSSGDTIWTKESGGGGAFLDGLASGIQDSDSTYVFAGHSESIPTTNTNAWLIKTDTAGNIVWQNTYGGSAFDLALNMDTTLDGGYILCGYSNSGFGAGGNDIYLVKTDINGNMAWNKWYGISDSDAGFVKTLPTGNYLIYGYNQFSDPDWPMNKAIHAVLMELDENGDQIWIKYFMNTDSASDSFYQNDEMFYAAEIVSDGIVLCGFSADSVDNVPLGWILKTDFEGNQLWSRRYRKRNDDNYLQDVVEVPGGDLVFCGFVAADLPGETQDGWLLRTNCLGFDQPPIAAGYAFSDDGNTVILDNNSQFFGNCIIDWGDGFMSNVSEFDDTLVSHPYATAGNYDIEITAIACNDTSIIIVLATATAVGIKETEESTFDIYPNPADETVTVRFKNISNEQTKISIVNLSGQIVHEQFVSDIPTAIETVKLDVSQFASGTYVVRIMNLQGVLTRKLVIE